MKVVIAGGSGRLGRALSGALLARGDEVVVLSRGRDRDPGIPAAARIVTWSPPTLGDWVAELDGADAVVNLAGESLAHWPWTSSRKKMLMSSRVVPTRTLVDALAKVPADTRPTILLSASGTDLYEGHDAEPAGEGTPPADTFLGRLCVAWEAEALRAEALGVRVVLTRMSSVFAPGAAVVRVLALPFRLFVGGRLGSGRQWMSWVDIADMVGLYIWALDSTEIRGPLNVSAPDPRQQVNFARALGRALKRPSWFPTPAWAIRLLLRDQATLALGSRRVWPAKALAAGYVFQQPRLEESLENAVR